MRKMWRKEDHRCRWGFWEREWELGTSRREDVGREEEDEEDWGPWETFEESASQLFPLWQRMVPPVTCRRV